MDIVSCRFLRLIYPVCSVLATLFCGCKFPSATSKTSSPEILKPPPPPTDFGVVVAYDSIALNATDTIRDENCYTIMNDAILSKGKFGDSVKMKVLNITSANIKEDIKSVSLTEWFTKDEMEELQQRMSEKIYVLDPLLLHNCMAISLKEFLSTFKSKHLDEGWASFRNKFGKYGLHYFSLPLITNGGTKALLVKGGNGESHIGSRELIILTKVKDHWKIVKEITLGIS